MTTGKEIEKKGCDLKDLLNLSIHDEDYISKLDSDTIIRSIEQNPSSVDIKSTYRYPKSPGYSWSCFPLHQAIVLKAPVDIIAALISDKALKKDAVPCFTALHLALQNEASLATVKLLLEKRPKAVQEKGLFQQTPLHTACIHDVPLDIVSFLISTYPDALKKEDDDGHTPLHAACHHGASLDVLSLLVNSYPDALRRKEEEGYTPLHAACITAQPLDFILFLLEHCPEASIQKSVDGYTPFDLLLMADKEVPEDTKTLLSHVSAIFGDEKDDSSPEDIMRFFVKIMWWKGIRLVLDKYPAVIKTIDLNTNVVADFLCMVGHHCGIKTMWGVLCNEQELFAGV